MIETGSILIGLGANLPSAAGKPRATLKRALELLAGAGVGITQVSKVYETVAYPVSDQPHFINIAVRISSELSASDLLGLFQAVETSLGRKPAERWSARTLDIDLLTRGDAVLPDLAQWLAVVENKDPAAFLVEPVVPHPRLHRRAFVLKPLADIAPSWRHPYLGQTVQEMLDSEPITDQLWSISEISAKL
ncbi:MAG: 2-amino-4-hydroxy-6-hydroxymethyldihydropteridine diphosphokinase [Kordiimonadales bacterium]|nr:MAG: 2-amino-4-hydroxy-6-hydroxymethyldihydropteridine diphosphokinase [Kordiimonadales bacterium]